MDKIRCSADMRWKMSRWAEGLCHHDSGLEGRLRPVCPAVRASASFRERDLSQGCGEAWLLVPSLQWAAGRTAVQTFRRGSAGALGGGAGPSPHRWEGREPSSCFKTWIKPASERESRDGPLPGRGRGLGQTGIWSQRRPVPSGFSWKNWASWTRTSRR